MKEILKKWNWIEISSASNFSDDMWVKDKYVFVHGHKCYSFYIEVKVDGRLLSIDDKRRVTNSYDLDRLNQVLRDIDIEINSRLGEIRNNKLKKIGI
jgi:hypothetical protein